jgi:eukaryotic-like serine/threonine-protein kinase
MPEPCYTIDLDMVRPGDRLGERYVVVEQIAAGGMGTLWRAHHVELDVDVALKVIAARASTPASLKRFKREAQAAARLRSPNIVQVLDYGEFDGQPYLAMELLRGEDLAAVVARGKLPLERCARILDGVAKAVQLAHDAGIVHRDLKPGNIFLERIGDEEVVKVLDFGIAKDLAAAPDPGSTTGAGVVGSPAYMSPEQVWARKVGYRADVWALGVVAFEMVTGKNPFMAETLAKIFQRIIRDPLPNVREFEPDLPRGFDAFFESALARDPAERTASVRELAERFRSALEGCEASVSPRSDASKGAPPAQGATTTVRRRARSKSTLRLGLLVTSGGAMLVVGIFLYRMSKSPPADQAVSSSSKTVSEAPVTPLGLPARPVPGIPQARSSGTAREALPVLPRPPAIRETAAAHVERRASAPPSARPDRSSSPTVAPPERDPKFGIPLSR